MDYEVIRQVNLPVMKKIDEEPIFVRFESPMYVGKQLKRATDTKEKNGKTRSPATLAAITNMETGEQFLLIINQVLKDNLNDGYPDDSYVGKTFRIVQHSREGKSYKTYSLSEISLRKESPVEADKKSVPVATLLPQPKAGKKATK